LKNKKNKILGSTVRQPRQASRENVERQEYFLEGGKRRGGLMMEKQMIHVIGGGLAGTEAA
jgi:hypothetical protein